MRNFLSPQTSRAMTVVGFMTMVLGTVACAGEPSSQNTATNDSPKEESLETSWIPRDAPVRSGYFPVGDGEQAQEVQYAVVDGMAIVEGDIVLGTLEEIEAFTAEIRLKLGLQTDAQGGSKTLGLALPGTKNRWKDKTVAYTIDPGLDNVQRVTDAMAHWTERTSIRFVERTTENARQYKDYVIFRKGSGCSANVGKAGRKQYVTLDTGCGVGATIHEIGHAVGLWHEQSREDRNDYITINLDNVDSSMQHNFDQHIRDGDDIGSYDFGSIMHYGAYAFSKNGLPTIVTKNGESIGNRAELSTGDIAAVAAMYP